jgi:hypothetical protein
MLESSALLFANYPVQAGLLVATSCFSVFLAVFGLHRRASRGATEFVLVMAAVAEWNIAYFLELAAPALSLKLLAAQIEYLGIATLPVLWPCCAGHTGRIDLARPRIAELMLVPCVTIALAFTNPAHQFRDENVDGRRDLPRVSGHPRPDVLGQHGYAYLLPARDPAVHVLPHHGAALLPNGLLRDDRRGRRPGSATSCRWV